MNRARPKTSQEPGAAAIALTNLVCLLARQGAREWLAGGLEPNFLPLAEPSERKK
jgi:hypothetical protein